MKQKLSVNLKTSEDSALLKINQNRCKSCQFHSEGWKEYWGIAFPLPQQCSCLSPRTEQSVCLWLFIPSNTQCYFKDKWNTTVSKMEYSSWKRKKTVLWEGLPSPLHKKWLRQKKSKLVNWSIRVVSSFWLSKVYLSGFLCFYVRWNCSIFLLTRISLR